MWFLLSMMKGRDTTHDGHTCTELGTIKKLRKRTSEIRVRPECSSTCNKSWLGCLPAQAAEKKEDGEILNRKYPGHLFQKKKSRAEVESCLLCALYAPAIMADGLPGGPLLTKGAEGTYGAMALPPLCPAPRVQAPVLQCLKVCVVS